MSPSQKESARSSDFDLFYESLKKRSPVRLFARSSFFLDIFYLFDLPYLREYLRLLSANVRLH
ncbi:hypothetical protein BIFCAT_00021 [Bifidobacterium catenulatum DSM 16992 = JCM 1194 = LMG 11043]|uniref:Uncharacterized protein n=1 Tax=Bifidobacterium catenulatum DSM 16992 = JCM 1194 = LMG 11043 TaxID=566552 RepID=B6XSE3_9BIFI|nr:hypothetical protein BIFCAT_00021 [Bifidobacterium catenulatum DSM 16992 = JCM 1194 = LMG 11043]